ncbi:MAG: GrpB family protein [Burkholderiales bacterium]|nr:GrpB family protein [Burkholderiales bacterium]
MKVKIEPYTSSWKNDFNRHKSVIASAIGHLRVSIDHIGSTSLCSIAAKPVIDILVGVNGPQGLDETIEPIIAAGYAYVEKFTPGMPYRRFFVKLTPVSNTPLPGIITTKDRLRFGVDYDTVANIHVIERGSYHWIRHIAFRDYLLAHHEARTAYEKLKLEIAGIDFSDPLDYNACKEGFISEYQEKAVQWFMQKTLDQK